MVTDPAVGAAHTYSGSLVLDGTGTVLQASVSLPGGVTMLITTTA